MMSPRIALTLIASILATPLALGVFTACSQEESADPAANSAGHEETLWTCGMHPQVLEHEPGSCPICGMELVRKTAASEPAYTSSRSKNGERRISHWVAPMDPSYISDAPGKSPMGMDLVPVYADQLGDGASVSIDPVVVQNMGVRLERVKREPLFRHVRTIGKVDVAEDAVSVVNPRFSGWVERIHADKTGDSIEAGQPLVEIYSPELVAAQEEYLLAIRTRGPKSELARSARRKLGLLGLDDRDVKALASSRQVQRAVPIRAPRSGYVLHKNVVEGARVPAGQDLYTIGDLSRIWVRAEVYAQDAPWVEVGQPAQMELTYERGGAIEGSVAYVYPTINEVSRTLSVRLEFPNPDLRLKPGMFATVYIRFQRVDDSLVVPTEAILHSGRREIVFVSLGEGRFEPREITTGLVGDRHTTQVLSGLREGEEVVTSGQFLLDSESQLQEAIAKMSRRRAGLDSVDPPEAELIYACPMHPDQTSHEPGRCPVCGMDLEPRATAPGDDGRDAHEAPDHAHSGGEER
jgi:Cu(I)/Ag(I) efflux system membrane fusion protein/cobalt-zinc-cadmium efflux system membrane fusion protein